MRQSSDRDRRAMALALLLLTAACAGQASPPLIRPNLDEPARQKLPERYKLTDDSDWLIRRWIRGQEKLGFGELHDILEVYPTTRSLYARAQTRGMVLAGIAGIGGGIAGFTLGYNLAVSDPNRMSGETQ